MREHPKFEEFQKLYPNLFKTYPRSGFALSNGWDKLVHGLCAILEHHIKHLPEEVAKDISVAQVKEKFGGLRFYMVRQDEFISGAIALAEYMSFSICEECGESGKRRGGGWLLTLCDAHHEEREQWKKEVSLEEEEEDDE